MWPGPSSRSVGGFLRCAGAGDLTVAGTLESSSFRRHSFSRESAAVAAFSSSFSRMRSHLERGDEHIKDIGGNPRTNFRSFVNRRC